MEEFYTVQTYPGDFLYHFKTLKHAQDFLWEYYLDWQENENQDEAANLLEYTNEIPNYGKIFKSYFEDVE